MIPFPSFGPRFGRSRLVSEGTGYENRFRLSVLFDWKGGGA